MSLFFYRKPSEDDTSIQNQIVDSGGAHRFYRASGPLMQRRFVELVKCDDMPRILIHGNPHIANYCKTSRGAAMVDFDRSRIGPYAYDIVRFLISVSLANNNESEFLHPVVEEHFRRGYTYGLLNRKYEHEEMLELKERVPRKWQSNASSYLSSGRKWAKKLFSNKVEITTKRKKMLRSYEESLGEDLLSGYQLTTCSEVPGSMGKMHFLYLMESHTNDDPIIIDIKEVYDEEDTEWFKNPFHHHGVRMNTAGSIYAPGWEQMPGHASFKNEQYWARQIPIHQEKLSIPIDTLDQCDLCFAVGAQLGRGHSKASKKFNAKDIFKDFRENYDLYLEVAKTINGEILAAHEVYCAAITLQKYGYNEELK